MFAPHCPACRTQVLVGPRRVVAVGRSDEGVLQVMVRCFCGAVIDGGATGPRRGPRAVGGASIPGSAA